VQVKTADNGGPDSVVALSQAEAPGRKLRPRRDEPEGSGLRWLRPWLGVVLLALGSALSAGAGLWTLRSLDNASALLSQASGVIEEAEGLRSSLVDAETGQRGFLLTGEGRYLQPYEAAVARIPDALERLGSLVADNPALSARLPSIRDRAAAKLAELAQTIAFRRSGDVEGALRVVLSDAGRAQMQALRAEIALLSDRERGRVAESIAERDRSFALAFVLVGVSGLLATALATVAGIGTVRHQREARERAERALSAEEARYYALIEASAQLTWAMRPDGSLVFVSRSLGEYTGLGAGAGVVSAAEWTSLIHPDDRERVRTDISRALERGAGFDLDLRIRRADGAWRWIQGRAEPVRDPSGKVFEWVGTTLDVHDRREAEARTAERESRFRAVFTSIDEGFCLCELIVDAHGRPADYRFLEVNPQFERMTGLVGAAGRTALEMVPGLERHWIETYGRVALEGQPARVEQESAVMGRWFDVFATPVEPHGRFAVVFRDVTERRRAERELSEREAQLRTIVDTVPVGLVIAELPSGRIVGGNRQVEEMLRHPVLHSPDIDSYGEWVAFHPDGRRVESREYPLARMVLDGEENPSVEVHYQRGDGTRAWMRMMGRPVRNGAGEVVGGVVALLDVDGERRAREELAAREARLRATIASAPFPILLHAEDGEILQASEAWQEISGWRWPDDIPTIADWTERAYGERKEVVRSYVDTLYARDRRLNEGDYRIQTKHDGERVWSFGSAPVGRDERGRRLVVSMAADVTDLRRAEAALARALAEQRAVYANAPAGLAAHDRDLRFIAVNARLAAINGLPAEAHIGRTPREVIPGTADSVEPLIRHVLETGEPIPEVEIETETAAHPGERRFYQASYYPVRDAEGDELLGVSIAVLDIDARKRAEAALQELAGALERRVEERTRALSESVAELEAFAYTVSHDLRAPLRGMEGFAQALIEDYAESLGSRGQRYAERIAAAAQRMDGLIGDLLEYSRLSRAEVTVRPVDPAGAVVGALADVGEAIERTGAAVEVVTPMPEVLASPPVLRQVLANLIGNAVKFVPNGEAPRVKIWAEWPSPARSGQVRFWVEDNGIGVEPEHRDRVFRVFERLHSDSVYPGTGIGLAIVRRGAERMGGSAGLEDRPDGGRGSRFWVDLPAVR
jgi:PAS domain S-box-containing protein